MINRNMAPDALLTVSLTDTNQDAEYIVPPRILILTQPSSG